MKNPILIKGAKTAEEKAVFCRAYLYGAVWALVARLLGAMRYKAFILILVCILLPGYGDNYITYAVGSMAVYTTGKALINNVANKKREVNEPEQPVKCSEASGTCTKSEGITDGSLWN